MRKVLGIVAGIVLANLLIFGWEYALPLLPFGQAIDPGRAEAADFVAGIPLAAQAWIAAGWGVGALAGGFVAFVVARWDFAGWIVAGFVAAAGIANITMIPHPLWMQLCAIANPFLGALVGFGLYRRWRARLHLHP